MTVTEAQARITSREFAEWKAFYRLEPFGEERADLRNGILAATIVNLFRSEGEEPAKATDFLPTFDDGGDEPVVDELEREFRRAFPPKA